MNNNRKTGKAVASTASKLLKNKKVSQAVKRVAASALSQAAPKQSRKKSK